MPKIETNVNSETFDFLKSRFELGEVMDENGSPTTDPAEMKVFSFDFITSKGQDVDSVVVSLLDDNESTNSVKVYFGENLSKSDKDIQKDWQKFLLDLRQFAKMHLLGFDVRNINKSTITKRDIAPVFESNFGPLDGTVKTSVQPLENMKIIIKHTARVNPKIKNSRSRRIKKIFLANDQGERFLLPFTSLVAARAMARHIHNKGNPYDGPGADICHLVEEMVNINKFIRKMSKIKFENPEVYNVLNAAKERYFEIKRTISSLANQGGYDRNIGNLTGDAGEVEDLDYDEANKLFGENNLDESSRISIPHIWRAYKSKRTLDEENEFKDWVTATIGDDSQEELDEADIPLGVNQSSPLSRTDKTPMNDFHSSKEINKHKNFSGKKSPLSLLSDEEGASASNNKSDEKSKQCPKCQAGPGRSCKDGSGKSRASHKERFDLKESIRTICTACESGYHEFCDKNSEIGSSAEEADYYDAGGSEFFPECSCPCNQHEIEAIKKLSGL